MPEPVDRRRSALPVAAACLIVSVIGVVLEIVAIATGNRPLGVVAIVVLLVAVIAMKTVGPPRVGGSRKR